MPENNHEIIIDGYVFPDTVTVTLANDEHVASRDYVSKDLYESVSSANDHWQAENDKLRKLVLEIWRSCPVSEDDCAKCPHYIKESEEVSCDIPILMEKLGVVMDA